ncbi:TonB-dependent receptor [Parabacteroides sp.]
MNNQRIVAFVNPKRAINIMKLTVLMLTVCLSQVVASTYSQTTKLTVSVKNETLENVLKQIERQSEFLFFYNLEEINKNAKISINKEDSNIQDILNIISSNTGLRYAIKDRHIVLYKAVASASPQQDGKRTISGIVKDAGGPIIGVNILEVGTSNGTISDLDGKFTLEVADNAVLKITYVGYLPQEIRITNQKSLNIVMKEDAQTLDELVVVGYGSVKKSDLTGSVSSVKAEDITKMATSSPVAALQGRAAGVSVSLGSGSPDATASIQIRGVGTPNDSSPLYVVDGFPMSDINHLSPNDIESIEILKDASACAIYGSRGANGVVVITTKKGKAGDLKVNVNAYYGIEHLASKPTMLNSSQYAELSNLAYANAGEDPLYSNTTNMPYNTDWYDAVSHLGQFQNYNVNMTGGGEKVQSVFSANYYRRDGIVKSTNFDRISLNQNNIFKATDFLKFTTSLSFAMTDHKRLDPTSIFLSSLIAPPDVPVIDPETNYYTGIRKMRLENPAGRIERNNGDNKRLYFVGNFSADLNLTKDLVFTSRFGIKVRNNHDSNFQPVFYETADNSTLMNTVSRKTSRTIDWTWENMMTYHHNFNEKHDLTVMGAMSARSYTTDSYSVSKQNVPIESKEFWYFDSATENPLASGDGAELTMLSYLGRINYNLLDRYLITASFRADGSSRFTKNNRWGYFPSGALAWKLSEEDFFKNWEQTVLSTAKVRAGYGAIGNENISSYYPYLTPIAQQKYYTLGQNQDRVNGSLPSGIGNVDAKWETSTQLNFGVDLSFFDNRLSMTADYYIRKTEDILLTQQIPRISGFGSMVRNVGGLQNKGFEFTLGFKGSKGDFTYSVNGNFALVKNEVTSLGTSQALVASFPYDYSLIDLQGSLGNIIRSEVGRPYGQFYGFVTDGIFQNQAQIDAYVKDGNPIQPDAKPGDFKFKDLNNNGKIDDGDMDFIGNPIPDVTYGLAFDATYKNFDLSLLFQGVAGNQIYNAAKYYYMRFDGKQNVREEYLNEYWRGENTSNTQPIPTKDLTRNSRNFRNSDYYVENGSYLRLKNIQLGYTFSPRLTEGFKPSIRLYISAQNLFTISGYSGFDPEVASDLSVDRGQYPQTQSFMVGTVINF